MRIDDCKIIVADFETTVFDGQEYTEVWAFALVELYTENVIIFGNIEDGFNYLFGLKRNIILYFHNLKFDGSFILDWLLRKNEWNQSIHYNQDDCYFDDNKNMKSHSYKYVISEKGQWYTITLKHNHHNFIEIRDSLKLLPFSLEKIGKSFETKHKKLKMDYVGVRCANCPISSEEKAYIKNDVLVLKEALEIAFSEGHEKLTIGSCCLAEYRKIMSKKDFESFFPRLDGEYIVEECYGAKTAEEYVRKSYKGAFCYVRPDRQGKLLEHGYTIDVNSLYPSRMHSDGKCEYPIGFPTFWCGNYIPEKAQENYFFIRIKCQFYLKEKHLPCVQIKKNPLYRANEWLTSSDINGLRGKIDYYFDSVEKKYKKAEVILTMTKTDYFLFLEQYDVKNLEILDGCWMYTANIEKECGFIRLFDEYIDIYRKIKENSKGARRELSKLFLNNLYGKFAMSDDSSFKEVYIDDKDKLNFIYHESHNRKPVYIPVGSAITSHARNYTIRAAQANYEAFCYADTDSLHNIGNIADVKGVELHKTKFGAWDHEGDWDYGFFTRQKTYIEHVIGDNPHYNVKCAGMGEKAKQNFIKELESGEKSMSDFNVGLKVYGNLKPKRIKGGTILVEDYYVMRPK